MKIELELTCKFCGDKWTASFTKTDAKRFTKNGWLLTTCNKIECAEKRRAEVEQIAAEMVMVDILTGEIVTRPA